MFVYDFIQIPLPFDQVRLRILDGHGDWLSSLATEAYQEEEGALVDVGLVNGHRALAKRVRIELCDTYEREGLVTVPLRWRATGIAGLFPVLDGELELAKLGEGRTHVCLLGRYDPPLGPVGRTLDRIVLHHLAEGTARSFLRRVADALVAEAVAEERPPAPSL